MSTPDRDSSPVKTGGLLAEEDNINVLSSDIIIACGMGLGTASEVALALKNKKKVILLTDNRESQAFFANLAKEQVLVASNPQEAMKIVKINISNTTV